MVQPYRSFKQHRLYRLQERTAMSTAKTATSTFLGLLAVAGAFAVVIVPNITPTEALLPQLAVLCTAIVACAYSALALVYAKRSWWHTGIAVLAIFVTTGIVLALGQPLL